MNPTFSREDALATLGGIAQLSAFALAMEQHHKALLAHVPESVWNAHFKRFPVWFDLYFEPPASHIDRLADLASRAEGLWPATPDASPLDTFNTLLARSRAMTREVATLRREVETAGQPRRLRAQAAKGRRPRPLETHRQGTPPAPLRARPAPRTESAATHQGRPLHLRQALGGEPAVKGKRSLTGTRVVWYSCQKGGSI
jgi:hypothetical protein